MGTEKPIALFKTKDPLFQIFQYSSPLIWRDGSGLSRYNMFTPSTFGTVLYNWTYQYPGKQLAESPSTDFLNFFPQGGTSGTLKDWYGPFVYAKTGTLSNNHALVGFIQTDKGKTLQFVLIANHYTVPTSTIRKSIGVILEKVKKGY